MAKTSIGQVTTAQTFQAWLDKTNQIVTLLEGDVMTASALGDTTTGNATLIGSFTANTVIAFNTLRADAISPKVGSTSISATAPINTTTSLQVAQTLTSTSGPRINLSSGSVIWTTGFENTAGNSFIIDVGSGAVKLKLTTSGNLSTSGSITSGTGGFIGNVTGNLTGNVTGDVTGNLTGNITGDVTGNLTGNVTGDVTGDVFASNGTTKVLENGNGTTVAATFTGNVTVPSGATLNASNASSISLPAGFGLVPTGGIIMWSGSVASIPTGWALCNGSSGTPDMRDRFVVGAGNSYAVGDTGGADSVTLTQAQMPAHTHTGSTNSAGNHNHTVTFLDSTQVNTVNKQGPDLHNIGDRQTGTYTTTTAGAHTHTVTVGSTGGGGSHENRPPYYALAYIMKL